jgi:hypothetical protein
MRTGAIPQPSLLSRVTIGGLLGATAFYLIVGARVLEPEYINWLLWGDPFTHFLGWHFFRREAWHFPIGLLYSYGMEMGSAIVYTDSIPLLAFFFKLLNPWLPPTFQYTGLWILLCAVLQGVFAYLLLSRVIPGVFGPILGSCFFLLSPVLWGRAVIQPALMAHWLILAALCLYVARRRRWSRWAWVSLVLLATWVHAYLSVMILGLWLADLAKRVWIERCLTTRNLGIEITATGLLLLVAAWLAGYFSVPAVSVSGGGFGFFSMNLLAPIDAYHASRLLGHIPLAIDGQYEGYNYLGLGMILLLVLACYELVRNRPSWATLKPYTPLLSACLLFSSVAVSNVVTLGPFVLFTIPLPESLQKVLDVFRSSGRLFWPTYYALMFVVMAVLARDGKTTLIPLLATTLAIQFFEVPPDNSRLRRLFKSEVVWESSLQSDFWGQASRCYGKILFVPQLHRAPNYGPFALLAANHGMAINVGYFARVPREKLERSAAQLLSDFRDGRLDPDALYVVNEKGLVRSVKFALSETDGIGEVDGFTVIAPGWFRDNTCSEKTSYLTRVILPVCEPLRIGETIGFSNRGNGANYLLHGWAIPEERWVWTNGIQATIGFRPEFKERKAGDLLLVIEGHAFVSTQHPRLAVDVLANGRKLGEWQFMVGVDAGQLATGVPRDLVREDDDLKITFRIDDPVSPKELGMGVDNRRLGLALRKMSLVWAGNEIQGSSNQ